MAIIGKDAEKTEWVREGAFIFEMGVVVSGFGVGLILRRKDRG